MSSKPPPDAGPRSEAELAAVCGQLGARRVGPLSAEERRLVRAAGRARAPLVKAAREAISKGEDPLGAWFCALRCPADRRTRGATYTPPPIVRSMIAWAAGRGRPARVVDPGAGSGRFLLEAARVLPDAQLTGIELDPLAALMARANLAASGHADRAEIHAADYRSFSLGPAAGATFFVGNPPYVRHHNIAPDWKAWLSRTAAQYGLSASQLAGLHVHFFLATLAHARPGDLGAFITAGEWLDVNYGKIVRDLLSGPLGVERVDVVNPKIAPFVDAQTTAVIACFRVGSTNGTVRIRKVDRLQHLASLGGGESISRTRLASSPRWNSLQVKRRSGGDLVELGELCRVHRGQVTGANAVWIASPGTPPLPKSVLRPAITKARELFASEGVLRSTGKLRRVIDLPTDLEQLSDNARVLIAAFLKWASQAGAHESYIARHRSPWWAVRLRAPAPILATYMARRPPAFVRNLAEARHINIAHGLYPREVLPENCLDALASYLAQSVSTDEGRTYAGGLTKFEPKEMERLLVPSPHVLAQLAAAKRAA